MDSLVQSLQAITEHMIEQLDGVTEEQIQFFIDQRESIVEQLKLMQITEADIEQYGGAVRKLLDYDPIITSKLEELRTEARNHLEKSNIAKVQNTAYNSTYTSDSSYYFDSKK
jgi:isoleucyl-tRNA synthetase